jgi:outer membrane lipoprotein-sorting protein
MTPTPEQCSHSRLAAALACLYALTVFLLLAAPLAAGEKSSPPNPEDPALSGAERVEALLERVKFEQRRIESLEAGFVQRQESAMLLEPDVSSGTFSYVAPSSVRWEYAAPKPISVVIDGEEMLTWYRDLGRAERLKVGRYSDQVLKYMGASGSLDSLREYFQVRVRFPDDGSDAPYKVDLMPRYERVARRMAGMTVWVDRDRFLPVRLRYETADGDVTEYEFQDLKINDGIPSDRFHLDLPTGVEVREVSLDRS